jgi:hypothetical protein
METAELRILLFALYLTWMSYLSERSGVAVLCTSALHQQAVLAARDLIGLITHDWLISSWSPAAPRRSRDNRRSTPNCYCHCPPEFFLFVLFFTGR